MEGIADIVEEIATLNGVTGLIITDESGSPMEFPGIDEDDEKAAITAFVGGGVNSLADILDLEGCKSISMNYDGGAMIVCPIGDIYLGVTLSEGKKLFKIEAKITEILS